MASYRLSMPVCRMPCGAGEATGQTKKAETPAAKTPNGTKQTDKDIKKEPENKKTKYICFMPIRDRPTSLPDRMFRY